MSTTVHDLTPGDSTIVGRDNPAPVERPVTCPLSSPRADKDVCHFPANCRWGSCDC